MFERGDPSSDSHNLTGIYADLAPSSTHTDDDNFYDEYVYSSPPEEGQLFPHVHTAAKVVLGISYTLMIPVCSIGNLLLCCVIYRFRRMRTTTNLLIGNLALSDFIVAAVVAPFNFFYSVHQTWPFGQAMCVTVGYLKATSFYVSINSLLAIAIDRYIIIMHPLKPRMTTYRACFVLCFIWLFSLAIVIPTALYSSTHLYYSNHVALMQCGENWRDSSARKCYALVLVIGEFLIPLTIMSVAYFLIARKLWFRRVPGGHVTAQQEIAAETSKRRTIRLLIIVVALFALCWAPYHVLAICRDIIFPTYQESHHAIILTVFYLVEALAMSNSMFNTLIYVVFNANVRKYVLQIPDSCRRLKPKDKSTVRYWHPLSRRTSSHCLRSSVRSSQLRTTSTSIPTRLTINLNRQPSAQSSSLSGPMHDPRC
ncbi:prokineticin receptor 2-like [Diadema setosum]|uniref:prokineticin receptor 2-like n=1 Tax=Diadema setosum TaxID=31175 RepID=UPI003B3B07CB